MMKATIQGSEQNPLIGAGQGGGSHRAVCGVKSFSGLEMPELSRGSHPYDRKVGRTMSFG